MSHDQVSKCADCGRLCGSPRCIRCGRGWKARSKRAPVITAEDTSADWRELIPEPLGCRAIDSWEVP